MGRGGSAYSSETRSAACMRVEFATEALASYSQALTRLHDLNPFAAQRFAERVSKALRRLGTFPRSGHFVPEYAALPVRQVLVEPYRFFYCVDERNKRVLIVSMWHGAQLPAQPNLPAP